MENYFSTIFFTEVVSKNFCFLAYLFLFLHYVFDVNENGD